MLKNKSNKKIVTILIIVILTSGVASFYFINKSSQSDSKMSGSTPEEAKINDINYNPPTEQDKKESDQNKESIPAKDEVTQTTIDNITPRITYAGVFNGSMQIGGYVSGIFEEGGKCTATLTKSGSQAISQSVDSIRGANSVDCPEINIPTNRFAAGSWSLVLSYKSNSYSGISEPKMVEVK